MSEGEKSRTPDVAQRMKAGWGRLSAWTNNVMEKVENTLNAELAMPSVNLSEEFRAFQDSVRKDVGSFNTAVERTIDRVPSSAASGELRISLAQVMVGVPYYYEAKRQTWQIERNDHINIEAGHTAQRLVANAAHKAGAWHDALHLTRDWVRQVEKIDGEVKEATEQLDMLLGKVEALEMVLTLKSSEQLRIAHQRFRQQKQKEVEDYQKLRLMELSNIDYKLQQREKKLRSSQRTVSLESVRDAFQSTFEKQLKDFRERGPAALLSIVPRKPQAAADEAQAEAASEHEDQELEELQSGDGEAPSAKDEQAGKEGTAAAQDSQAEEAANAGGVEETVKEGNDEAAKDQAEDDKAETAE